MTPEYLSDEDFVSSRRSQRLAALESEIETPVLPSLRPWHWGVAAGVVLAVVGVLWLVNGKSENGIQIIQADAKPFKVKPENPGGAEVPFQEMRVYDALPGNASPEEIRKQDIVDKIQPPPEEPVERPGSAKATRIITADTEELTQSAGTESLFDTSEAGEMPPPATAAEENMPAYVAENASKDLDAETLAGDGRIAGFDSVETQAEHPSLLPSDMVDAEPTQAESLLVPKDKGAATDRPLSLNETTKKEVVPKKTAPEKVPTIKQDMSKNTVKNLVAVTGTEPENALAPPVPVTEKAAVNTAKRVPFVEGHPIRATGPTAKSAEGHDVIDIRSPDREKPVEIKSEQPPKKILITSDHAKISTKKAETAKTMPRPAKIASAEPAPQTVKTAGGWRVQIAAVPEQSLAMSEWKRYKTRHSDLLGTLDVRVQQVNLGAKGIFYRVQAGVLDKAGAESTCSGLRQRGLSCMVVRD